MNWFSTWFNSPYYHLLYKNRDREEAELFISNLISYLKIPKNTKIIDIACGKGRHASYLNKQGMDVVGIDLSINNITAAKKEENPTLQFIVHDMREPFKENEFNIATNLFTSFGYFKKKEDEQKAINSMASNLKKEGILIIDFMNVKKVIRNLVKSENKIIEGVNFNIHRSIINDYIIKDINISKNGKHYKFKETVKALTLIEFSNLIKNAGLHIIDTFGNYQLEDFSALSSERLIMICKK
tara:strand:+ start:2657 stop:3379 length:723 start_codon:yes stop_codon:yes gene_type:complete